MPSFWFSSGLIPCACDKQFSPIESSVFSGKDFSWTFIQISPNIKLHYILFHYFSCWLNCLLKSLLPNRPLEDNLEFKPGGTLKIILAQIDHYYLPSEAIFAVLTSSIKIDKDLEPTLVLVFEQGTVVLPTQKIKREDWCKFFLFLSNHTFSVKVCHVIFLSSVRKVVDYNGEGSRVRIFSFVSVHLICPSMN